MKRKWKHTGLSLFFFFSHKFEYFMFQKLTSLLPFSFLKFNCPDLICSYTSLPYVTSVKLVLLIFWFMYWNCSVDRILNQISVSSYKLIKEGVRYFGLTHKEPWFISELILFHQTLKEDPTALESLDPLLSCKMTRTKTTVLHQVRVAHANCTSSSPFLVLLILLFFLKYFVLKSALPWTLLYRTNSITYIKRLNLAAKSV